ncbi:MAG: hypothetical protein WDL87_03450 [Candidatus Omnitrophota bacterium]|jgi:hypothetical protein
MNDLILKFITEIPIDYSWFFSTLAQSLAALISIGGVFIIYRLQLLENENKETVQNLQRYLYPSQPEKLFYLTKRETLTRADYEWKSCESQIKEQTLVIKDIDQRIKNEKEETKVLESRKSDCTNIIGWNKERISGFDERVSKLVGGEKYKNTIQWAAFITFLFMMIVFVLSLLGLIFSKYLENNIGVGNEAVLNIFILLLGALTQLTLCCMAGLNIGRPALKAISENTAKNKAL